MGNSGRDPLPPDLPIAGGIFESPGATVEIRRNSFDVSNTVDTTDHRSVNREVNRILLELFPQADTRQLDRCFSDVVRLYRGDDPAYRACDTAYHDIQHVLEVALAMARLMDGYERSQRIEASIGSRLFVFGVVVALFHDVGYLRHVNDNRHSNGAEYTTVHVSRGARFVQRYMGEIGMSDLSLIAKEIIHFTGYERPAARIRVPSAVFRLLGHMLGTADIIAQMADRCYLEKCRDRLFPEFVQGGLASSGKDDIRDGILFASAEDLIVSTPRFYKTATARLNEQLGEAHRYVERHFDGQNLYFEEMQKNVHYASIVAAERDLCLLRRSLN
jgi:hypothetical protein